VEFGGGYKTGHSEVLLGVAFTLGAFGAMLIDSVEKMSKSCQVIASPIKGTHLGTSRPWRRADTQLPPQKRRALPSGVRGNGLGIIFQ